MMKAWKEALAQALVDEWNSDRTVALPAIGETDRAVKFSDIAKAQGYKHINQHDIIDIMHQVTKIAPHLHPIRFSGNPKAPDPADSLWGTLYFTDLELD